MSTIRFKASTWDDVRKQVMSVNPEFARIIDKLSPGPEFTLYKVTYPYGSHILQKGDLYLPTKDGLVSLKDQSVSPTIKKAIGYNAYSNPVTMVLKNSAEMFIPIEGRIIPYSIVKSGDVFGLWTVLDGLISHCPPLFLWDMTAGARSVSMLSKISDSMSHRRLVQHYQIDHSCPKSLLDHWGIFTEIANDPSFGDPWQMEMLYFSRKWFDKLKDPEWVAFRSYLQGLAWRSSAYWRNQYTSNLMWTHIQREESIKPSAYTSDIVKHLFAVGVSALPGFAPALNDFLGPFQRIQTAYHDVYRMRDYPPIIMQPEYFDSALNNTVYVSLQFMSAMDLAPKSNDRSSTIADLYAVQSLVQKYLRGVTKGGFNMKGARLYEMANTVDYRFYHSDSGQYPNIVSSASIPKKDSAFTELMKKFHATSFPARGSFLRGCVSIASR
jgi:hypothetical protein